MADIPPTKESDPEDVVWGLQTADTLWRRGERIDALVWLRRAAQAAGDANDDDRALSLARSAADLTELMNAESELGDSDLLEEDDGSAHVDIDVSDEGVDEEERSSPAPLRPPPPIDDGSTPSIEARMAEINAGRPPDELPTKAPSVPPAVDVHAGMFDPWAEMSAKLPVPGPPPAEVPKARESEEEVVTSVRPNALLHPRSDPPTSRSMPISQPPPPLAPPNRTSRPSNGGLKAAAPIVSAPPAPGSLGGPPKPPPPLPPRARGALPKPSVPSVPAALVVEPPPEPELEAVSVMPDEPEAQVSEAQAPEPQAPEPQAPEPQAQAPTPVAELQTAIPSIPPAKLLDLEEVEAFSDLPDDAREAFAAAGILHELNDGEEIATFALAYVVSGTFDVAATMVDAPAGSLEQGAVLRSRGTTDEGVPMRLIAAKGSGVVATWSDTAVEEAFRSIPWVEEDLRAAADRMQTLVGITIGPLGERLDVSIRTTIVSKLKMRTLIPAEIVVNAGETVPGLLLVGIGELELIRGDEVFGVVGSGEFLFPSEVLSMGDAPMTARAGKGGALVMFGDRGVAQELLVTCPPLLEVFAGM